MPSQRDDDECGQQQGRDGCQRDEEEEGCGPVVLDLMVFIMKVTPTSTAATHALILAAIPVVIATATAIYEGPAGGGVEIVVEHGEGGTAGPGLRLLCARPLVV